MKVDALLVSDSQHLKSSDRSLEQLANAASLPGAGDAWAMADFHQGYGFPIGGVVATDIDNGGVSLRESVSTSTVGLGYAQLTWD